MDAMLCCPEKYEYARKHIWPFIKKLKENKNKKYPLLPRQQENPTGMGNPNTKLLLFGITTAESSNASVFVSKQNSIYMQTAAIVALCSCY